MASRMAQIGSLTVFMLIVLRMAIGWHFFREGVVKFQQPDYFSSAGFLQQAKGPLAEHYHRFVPQAHLWKDLLAQPLEDLPAKRAEAANADEVEEGTVPPGQPYTAWAEQILADWRATLQQFIERCQLADAQQEQAAEIFEQRAGLLLAYLVEESEAIADYRHQLARLEEFQSHPSTGQLPYHDERIEQKSAETRAVPGRWVADVADQEKGYRDDLWGLLSDTQKGAGAAVFSERGLEQIDTAVTYMLLGVGGCLLVGLFTRVAAFVGALFLLSIIGTQPPWIDGAAPMYKEIIESLALLALATSPVGRWGGLDFFVHALWQGCCGTKGTKK